MLQLLILRRASTTTITKTKLPSRPLQIQGSHSHQVAILPMVQYKLNLKLPRRHFNSGESIPFEITLDNPDNVSVQTMSIKLMQNTVYTKYERSFGSSHSRPALKLRSSVLVTVTNPVYSSSAFGGSWVDSLKIPKLLPPTTRLPLERLGSEQISEIQYALKVEVNKSEAFGTIVEEFPIDIGIPEQSRSLRPQTAAVPDIITSGQENSENFSELNVPRFGLDDKDGPPRYSMLSLPIVGASRSGSVETLPPHYDDSAHLM